MKPFSFLLLVSVLFWSCSGGTSQKDSIQKPYKFDRARLDELVKEKKALYDISKRGDGTLEKEMYYLGDTVKYELRFDEKSNLRMVIRYNEHGLAVWDETYHPNGQRKSHYSRKTIEKHGIVNSVLDGYFEQYYENGNVKERGVYEENQMKWNQQLLQDGNPADTVFYDYGENK